jgi:hypothetical protein
MPANVTWRWRCFAGEGSRPDGGSNRAAPACLDPVKLSNIAAMRPLPLLLAVALALPACSTPQQRAAAHQRDLQDEAREKFEEQKEQDKERADEVRDARERAADDAKKRTEEIADARQRAAEDAARYKAYETEYARQLGKKPSQLTPEERQWVRDHF